MLDYIASLSDFDKTVNILNIVDECAFIVCFAHMLVLFIQSYIIRHKNTTKKQPYRNYGIIISARNEERVITNLINSIKSQDYPAEYIDILLVADNCTDNTAELGRKAGAYVYERFNETLKGKGYAVDELIKHLKETGKYDKYDAFMIFDADNTLNTDYLTCINNELSEECQVVVSYRSSSNADYNWITASNAFWFLHECQFRNRGRHNLETCCLVQGTGYAIDKRVIERFGGWPFHMLTEDLEFTGACIDAGIRIGYCEKAVFFDEQPTSFKDSWKQRLRWVKGYFQVYRKYGKKEFKGIFTKKNWKEKFSCYDMLMSNLPAFFLMLYEIIMLGTATVIAAVNHYSMTFIGLSWTLFITGTFIGIWIATIFTVITERKQIRFSKGKLIHCVLVFPVFMLCYMLIAVQAIFSNVQWDPIVHTGEATSGMAKK